MPNEIRPIRTREDHEAACAEIDRLFDAEPGTPEGDRLDVLITLVNAWEDENIKWPVPDPVEAIRFHMEQTGKTQTDLARLLNSSSRASEILNRNRTLTLEMVWQLHREWGIPLESIAAPYEAKGCAPRAKRIVKGSKGAGAFKYTQSKASGVLKPAKRTSFTRRKAG